MDHVFISTLKKFANRFQHDLDSNGGASRWIKLALFEPVFQGFSKGWSSSFCMQAKKRKRRSIYVCLKKGPKNTGWFQSWTNRSCLLPMLHLWTIHSRPGWFFFSTYADMTGFPPGIAKLFGARNRGAPRPQSTEREGQGGLRWMGGWTSPRKRCIPILSLCFSYRTY